LLALIETFGRQLMKLCGVVAIFGIQCMFVGVGFLGLMILKIIIWSIGGVRAICGLFQADPVMLVVGGLLLWPLWNYAALAAFPFFAPINYGEAVGLIIIAHLLRSKHYVAPQREGSQNPGPESPGNHTPWEPVRSGGGSGGPAREAVASRR
jgi:hypothetical protein